jgi:hypothetical protein
MHYNELYNLTQRAVRANTTTLQDASALIKMLDNANTTRQNLHTARAKMNTAVVELQRASARIVATKWYHFEDTRNARMMLARALDDYDNANNAVTFYTRSYNHHKTVLHNRLMQLRADNSKQNNANNKEIK